MLASSEVCLSRSFFFARGNRGEGGTPPHKAAAAAAVPTASSPNRTNQPKGRRSILLRLLPKPVAPPLRLFPSRAPGGRSPHPLAAAEKPAPTASRKSAWNERENVEEEEEERRNVMLLFRAFLARCCFCHLAWNEERGVGTVRRSSRRE